jgi:ATP-dependent Lhr-like helicase
MSDALPATLTDWFTQKGWQPHAHQLQVMEARGSPACLLIAPTGCGKTLAGFLPSLADLAQGPHAGLHTLYVSPLKALAADIKRNLRGPAEEMGLDIRIEDRTGDTSATQKRRQRMDPPQILLTTPESLALLTSYGDAERIFFGLKRVVIDEVHALSESKRGDQLMLSLAALQKICPDMQRIGLSATVQDPQEIARFMAYGDELTRNGSSQLPP